MRRSVCMLSCLVLAAALGGSGPAAAEERTALVVGNGAYRTAPLKNAVNDAADIAASLGKLGFSVMLVKDAGHREMEDAIRELGRRLRMGGAGLFFYAGHGIQVGGRNYLVPVGVEIEKETDVKYKAVDAEMVLDEMGAAGNPLNIVILDACRDNPFGRGFRSASRGLAVISDAPKGMFITYSTSPGKVAADGTGRNSPYTESLIRHMNTPGLPIEEVFKEVRRDLGSKTKGAQVPWELSSLEGKFFFRPGPGEAGTDPLLSLPEERTQADDARPARGQRNGAPAGDSQRPCAESDGRFCKYADGTVLDTQTHLMWAARDNGSDIDWTAAGTYCRNFGLGGHTDWRLPTQEELAGIFDRAKTQPNRAAEEYPLHLTGLIELSSCCAWAAETRKGEAAALLFYSGERYWQPKYNGFFYRVLPVRNAK